MTYRRLGAAGQPKTAEKGGERGRYRVATINGRMDWSGPCLAQSALYP